MQGAKAKKQKQEEEAAAALENHMAKAEEQGRKSPEKEGPSKEDYVRKEQKKLMPDFQGEMRDYQVKGVKWLISLWNVSRCNFRPRTSVKSCSGGFSSLPCRWLDVSAVISAIDVDLRVCLYFDEQGYAKSSLTAPFISDLCTPTLKAREM